MCIRDRRIAFPLISTGVYGFPKNKALQIAVSVFSQFLTENEIEIILVVFDKESFQLSERIVGDIDAYIDANYVKESHKKEYPVRSRSSARMRELSEEVFYEVMPVSYTHLMRSVVYYNQSKRWKGLIIWIKWIIMHIQYI